MNALKTVNYKLKTQGGFTPTPIISLLTFCRELTKKDTASVGLFKTDYLAILHAKPRDNRCRGFTLVELIVVIAIIGILSSIILASLSQARAKSRDVVRETDLEQLGVALRAFAEQNGRYPSSADGSCTYYTSFGSGGCLQALVSQGFASTLPVDPLNGSFTSSPHSDHMYFYDNWCRESGTSDQQYRMWGNGERNHDGIQYNWWTDETIGVTTCADPS